MGLTFTAAGNRGGSSRCRLYYPLFCLSGAAALLYQVVWLKQLSFLFGATIYAVGTTLAVFMLGLALGSRWFGSRVDAAKDPLGWYVALEFGIAATAFCSIGALGLLHSWLGMFTLVEASPALRALARLAGAALVLVVPSFLMGGTLPVLARHCVSAQRLAGAQLGRLYAANTLGGALGALLAGFVIIPAAGLRAALLTGVAINALVALLALATRLAPGDALPKATEALPARQPTPAPGPTGGAGAAYGMLMLGAFSIAGLVGLSVEVVWTRLLQFFLYHTAQAFAGMLAVYLTGLTLGSLAASFVADRVFRPERAYGLLQICVGVAIPVFALLTVGAGEAPGAVGTRLAQGLPAAWQSPALLELSRSAGHVLLLILLPTALMGAAFPFAAKHFSRAMPRLGSSIGAAAMGNMIGSTLGPLLWGFVLLPAVGLQRALVLCAGLSLTSGLALLFATGRRPGAPATGALVGAALTLGGLLLPEQLVSRTYEKTYRVLSYEEDLYGSVAVTEESDARETRRSLRVGATSMINDGFFSRRYTRLLGHLPLLLQESPRSAVVICLGSGMTLTAVARHRELEDIDCVELSGAVVRAARRYFASANAGVLSDPRVRVIVNDGRNHLLAAKSRYDLVALEPPPPNNDGVASLYSVEFYELCRQRLRPGGMVVQWIPLHSVTYGQALRLMASMQSVFPDVTLWEMANGIEYAVIGHLGEWRTPYARLERRFSEPVVAASLAEVGVGSVADLAATFVMGPERIRELAGSIAPVTDDLPRIGYDLESFVFDHPDQNVAHSSSQLASLRIRRHREHPAAAFVFDSPQQRREFEDRVESTLLTRDLHLGAVAAAALLPDKTAEALEGLALELPVLRDPENPYYRQALRAGIYARAFDNSFRYYRSIGRPEQAVRSLGLLLQAQNSLP